MGMRKRIAYVYPGKFRSGVAAAVLDDNLLFSVAVSSVDNSSIPGLLDLFKPDEMTSALDKFYDRDYARVYVPSSVRKFRYARPGWAAKKVPFTNRTSPAQGVYVHNVWKLFFDDAIRKRDLIVKHLDVKEFNQEWVEANRPPGVRK